MCYEGWECGNRRDERADSRAVQRNPLYSLCPQTLHWRDKDNATAIIHSADSGHAHTTRWPLVILLRAVRDARY